MTEIMLVSSLVSDSLDFSLLTLLFPSVVSDSLDFSLLTLLFPSDIFSFSLLSKESSLTKVAFNCPSVA